MNGSSVEISIGQSGEDCLDGKVVNLIAALTCLVGTVGITGDIFTGINQRSWRAATVGSLPQTPVIVQALPLEVCSH
jgi:hypothetical protein